MDVKFQIVRHDFKEYVFLSIQVIRLDFLVTCFKTWFLKVRILWVNML